MSVAILAAVVRSILFPREVDCHPSPAPVSAAKLPQSLQEPTKTSPSRTNTYFGAVSASMRKHRMQDVCQEVSLNVPCNPAFPNACFPDLSPSVPRIAANYPLHSRKAAAIAATIAIGDSRLRSRSRQVPDASEPRPCCSDRATDWSKQALRSSNSVHVRKK